MIKRNNEYIEFIGRLFETVQSQTALLKSENIFGRVFINLFREDFRVVAIFICSVP